MRQYEWIRECDWLKHPDPEDLVVEIDIYRFDMRWAKDDPHRYFTPADAKKQIKFHGFGQWLATAAEPIVMPHVGGPRGAWSFRNGRHRFCWFRDLGYASLPVTVYVEQAYELRRIAGW
jgi:hypothetical protein